MAKLQRTFKMLTCRHEFKAPEMALGSEQVFLIKTCARCGLIRRNGHTIIRSAYQLPRGVRKSL